MPVSLPYGRNLRNTLAFVTDNAPYTFANETNSFGSGPDGWVTAPSDSRNRNAANDPRLAGTLFDTGGIKRDWKVVLPSSGLTIPIRFAIGDDSYAHAGHQVEILDNNSGSPISLFTVTFAGTLAAGHYVDANGTEHTSAANWVSNNTSRSVVMTTDTILFRLGDGTHVSYLAHLAIDASTGGPVQVPYQPWSQRGPILAQ